MNIIIICNKIVKFSNNNKCKNILEEGIQMKKAIKWHIVLLLALSLMPIKNVRASELNNQTDIAEQSDGTVLCSTISTPNDLQNLIDTDVNFSSQDIITTAWTGTGSPHKIVVTEKGWIFIKVFEKDKYTNCNLYSNFALTSLIATVDPYTDNTNTLACYVDPGSYYYQISRWNGYDSSETTCYVGFMPSSARIKVDKIKYSEDKSVATVIFDYDEDYLKNFVEGFLRVIPGSTSYRDIYNNQVWKTENKENALEANKFYATSNGTYTARIASGNNDNYFCDVSFEITDIACDEPLAPKITTCKNNSKTVSGTGLAGTKVVISISGMKYSATVDAKGIWNIASKTKIKSGTKITAFIKNTAGKKSKSTTVTVK